MREKDKHKDGEYRSKSKTKVLEGFEGVRRINGELIERSITPSDLYNNGGVLAGSGAGGTGSGAGSSSSSSRPSSPVASSILKKRTSFPVSGPLANILNFSPHRRRPSLQTKNSHSSSTSQSGPTSAGPPQPTSTYPHAPAVPLYSQSSSGSHSKKNSRSRSGSANSPTIGSIQHTPIQTPTTSTNLGSLRTFASESTTTLASTASSSLSSMNPSYDGTRGGGSGGGTGGDSPTVPPYEGLESPLSTRSHDTRLGPSSRFADAYATSRYEDTWDSDQVDFEDDEEQDERTGTRMIPASRRIMTPQTPIRELAELSAGTGGVGGGIASSEAGRYNTFRRGLGIADQDLGIKSRSNSSASSRAGGLMVDIGNSDARSISSMTPALGPSKVVQSRRIVEGNPDLLHTHPSGSETTITRTEGDSISRPGSASPHPEMRPKTPTSSSRSNRDDATSSISSTSASLRASSLNQVAAIKRQRELVGEDGPPRSSSSNSSSEALSTTSHGRNSRFNRHYQKQKQLTLTAAKDGIMPGPLHSPALEPPLPDPLAPRVDPAPSSGMYWYKAFCHGLSLIPVRAHTCTLVGSSVYVFGGCDPKGSFNDLYVFDADSMYWSKPQVSGDIPPPIRAMTTTAINNKKLIIFGGGEGKKYYNDVYVLDTLTHRYTKPKINGQLPSKRRAHTACFYKNGLYVFGGGDGGTALNDVWRLDVADVNKMSWKLISAASANTTIGGSGGSVRGKNGHANASQTSLLAGVSGSGANTPNSNKPAPTTLKMKPNARGYHTANMVQNKLIIFGGSDGVECFKDVWVFDVDTSVWKSVDIKVSFPRLSHTATIIGSYLFVVGGHDGVEYSNEVLLLNLVTMQWDKRKVYGLPPSGRGYHGAVLHDSRLFVIGGFDGHNMFNDTYILELAISSYYSQISHFNIEV